MSQIDKQNRFKAAFFHALSDPIRLEIVEYLRDGEKCVCQIVPHLNLIQPLISRHLKILKDAGIVKFRKDGTKRIYAIVDERIYRVVDALNAELREVVSKEAIKNVAYE
jgi:DNA-binding transcriptional ArsR family regulator